MAWNTTDIDWTSPATIQPALSARPYLVLSDIANALRERDAAAGRTKIAQIVRGDKRGKIIGLNTELTALIPLYANQTINGGDFNNEASIPAWSVADLEAEIGESRPAAPARNGVFSCEWAWWMYEAINLLLWHRGTTPSLLGNSEGRTRQGIGVDLAAAAASFDANSWTSWGPLFFIPLANHYYSQGSVNQTVFRAQRRMKEIAAITEEYYYKVDAYLSCDKFQSGKSYANPDYGTDADKLTIVHSDASPRISAIPSGTIILANFDGVTLTTVNTEYACQTQEYGGGKELYLVRKYDVVGGFSYLKTA